MGNKLTLLCEKQCKQAAYKPEDFGFVKYLGEGFQATVMLVQKKNCLVDKSFYAMKRVLKNPIIKNKITESIKIEKKILKDNKSPFISKMRMSFQTDQHLYFILEHIQGGDLRSLVVRAKSGLPELIVKFLAAEIILGLQYLHHEMKVIFRDLKTENIMITAEGNIKLIDFGLAQNLLQINKPQKSTIAGTQEYFAPEIVQGQDITQLVDIWALGILIYEMIEGKTPFYDNTKDDLIIYKKIIKSEVKFSQKFSENAQDLIKKLLEKNWKKRLGYQNYNEIKDHAFFKKLDWKSINEKKFKSPLAKYTHHVVSDSSKLVIVGPIPAQNVKEKPMKKTLTDFSEISHRSVKLGQRTVSNGSQMEFTDNTEIPEPFTLFKQKSNPSEQTKEF